MKTLISGHRKQKLCGYDIQWIEASISNSIFSLNTTIGLSGMADGIDLIFCSLLENYHCYIPFENQDEYMSEEDKEWRKDLIKKSRKCYKAKNSQMVRDCDNGIIVWDGNKGGTHNVFQQMVECGKPFFWIEPINKRQILIT